MNPDPVGSLLFPLSWIRNYLFRNRIQANYEKQIIKIYFLFAWFADPELSSVLYPELSPVLYPELCLGSETFYKSEMDPE